MNQPSWRILFLVELRRLWTIYTVLSVLLVAAIGTIMTFIMPAQRGSYNVAVSLIDASLSLSPIIVVVFGIGIIANDVKDGWLRTLLIRPLTRQQYLFTKAAVVFTSSWIVTFIAVFAPTVIRGLLTSTAVVWNAGTLLASIPLLVAHSVLLLFLMIFFSCWLPGAVNAVLLAAWAFLSQMLYFYISTKLWDARWAVVLQEYFFPSGFLDALMAIRQGTHTPLAEIAWGCAALSGVIWLSIISITKIQIDKTSE